MKDSFIRPPMPGSSAPDAPRAEPLIPESGTSAGEANQPRGFLSINMDRPPMPFLIWCGTVFPAFCHLNLVG
jgi:hypothetical protein